MQAIRFGDLQSVRQSMVLATASALKYSLASGAVSKGIMEANLSAALRDPAILEYLSTPTQSLGAEVDVYNKSSEKRETLPVSVKKLLNNKNEQLVAAVNREFMRKCSGDAQRDQRCMEKAFALAGVHVLEGLVEGAADSLQALGTPVKHLQSAAFKQNLKSFVAIALHQLKLDPDQHKPFGWQIKRLLESK